MGRSGLSRVEYHGTDAEASLTSGRRPSGVGGYIYIYISLSLSLYKYIYRERERVKRLCAQRDHYIQFLHSARPAAGPS